MPKYYKTDSRKVGFREYWNITKSPAVLFPWLAKLFSIPLALPGGIPAPCAFRDAVIGRDEVPTDVLGRLELSLSQCRQAGFSSFWFYTSKDLLMPGNAFGIEMLHNSGESIGKVIHATFGSLTSLVTVFLSVSDNGKITATTNKKPELNAPPEVDTERMAGFAVAELWQRHLERLSAARTIRAVRRFQGFDDVASFEDEWVKRIFEYQVSRGVWVEMSESEVAALRR